jgi:hypothetical protein
VNIPQQHSSHGILFGGNVLDEGQLALQMVEDWLCVDHTKKLFTGIKLDYQQFPIPPFSIVTVDKLMRDLSMDEERAKDYKLVIIGVNDASLHEPDGLLFAYNASYYAGNDDAARSWPAGWS